VSVLDRKLRRDLFRAKGTLLAVLLVIVVGIACFVGMVTSYGNLTRSQREYYARCRMADFWIDLKKAPLPALDRIARLPGVAELLPRIVFEATVDLEDVYKPLAGQVISLPDERRPVLNNIVMQRGSYFTDERLEQVIVLDTFAEARKIRPGQTIHILLNNRRQELFVAGTALSSEFVYQMSPGSLAPAPADYGVFFIKRRFAEEALDFDGACNQIVGRFTPAAREDGQRVLDEIELRLDEYGVFATTRLANQPSNRFLSDEIHGLKVSAAILPLEFLGVAALVLNILMTRLAQQQRVTVGTLKALGHTNRTLMWHYLKFGIVIGAVGGALGIGIGHLLAEGMTSIYREFYKFPRLENHAAPAAMVAALLISIVFSMLGTIRGVRVIVRLSPAEAMRARPPAITGGIALERFGRLWRAIGFRWQMVVRSVWRHKWRTVVGMLAAALGSAILLIACYFMDSMFELIDFQFDKVLRSDIDLTFKDELDGGALLEARRLPAVDYAEPVLNVACKFRHGHRLKRGAITGLISGAILTIPRDREGNRIRIPHTGLAMSRKLADLLDLARGDSITVIPVKGLREPVDVPVVSITDSYIGMSTYADYDYLNALVGETHAISAVQLSVRPGLAHRLALYRRLKELPTLQGMTDVRQMRADLVALLLKSMKIAMGAMIVFAGAIFFGSILTTSLVALSERQREVATLLVMGYEKRQVGGIFLRESLLVNMSGALLGLPLGFVMILILIQVYNTELYRMPLVNSPQSYAITVACSVLFVLAAHLIVQRAINRLIWQEALNVHE
jgi:putative ABC transport system permease protein